MWVAIVVFVLAAAGSVAVNLVAEKRRSRSALPDVISALGAVLTGFSVIFAIAMGAPSHSTQLPPFREQVQERYGLELTPEQFNVLEYPANSPKKGLQTYGATVVEEKVEGNLYRKQKVQLISEDGKLKLAHYEEGKGFEELPRKGTNR